MQGGNKQSTALDGRVIVITGGGRGIGLATAKALAARGAKIAIGDIDAELAHTEAQALGCFSAALDVRDRNSFAAFLNKVVETLGPIDVLINNAGIMPAGAFHAQDPALDDAQIDINFRGVIYGTQLVLPQMLERNTGHIINVASLAGRFAIPGLAVYCGTKFAVVGFTESLSAEYRKTALNFSTIMPTKVRTELAAGTDRAGRGLPSVDPEDIARAIVATLLKPRLFVAIPQYMESFATFYRFMPQRLTNFVRQRLRDDRVLTKLDLVQRDAYDQRLRRLSGNNETTGG